LTRLDSLRTIPQFAGLKAIKETSTQVPESGDRHFFLGAWRSITRQVDGRLGPIRR
jgi:hypothetical protein